MKRIVALLLVSLIHYVSYAQDWKKLEVLKDQSEVEVVFKYGVLKLLDKNMSEQEYVDTRRVKMNEKLEDSGDLWATSWMSAKENLWQPKFTLLLNKYSKDKVRFLNKPLDSKYLLLVNVYWIYPGWDAGIVKQGAKVTSAISLVERANPDNIIVTHVFKNMPGNQFGNNFNDESRIAEGFAKTGKELGKVVAKNI